MYLRRPGGGHGDQPGPHDAHDGEPPGQAAEGVGFARRLDRRGHLDDRVAAPEEEPADAVLGQAPVQLEVETDACAEVGGGPLGVAGAHDDVVEDEVGACVRRVASAPVALDEGGESPGQPTEVEAAGVTDEAAPLEQPLGCRDVVDAEGDGRQAAGPLDHLDLAVDGAEPPPRVLRGGGLGAADGQAGDAHPAIMPSPAPSATTAGRRGSPAALCQRRSKVSIVPARVSSARSSGTVLGGGPSRRRWLASSGTGGQSILRTTESGSTFIAEPTTTQGFGGTSALGLRPSMATTIARTPVSVSTMNFVFCSTFSFISERM